VKTTTIDLTSDLTRNSHIHNSAARESKVRFSPGNDRRSDSADLLRLERRGKVREITEEEVDLDMNPAY
jgi:hypothetical protein